MNNNFKKWIIYIFIAVLSSAITFEVINYQKQIKISKYKESVKGDIGIKNINENKNYTIPEFSIPIYEKTQYNLTNDKIKDLPIYDINALISNEGIKVNIDYTGVKLLDIINLLNIKDYNTVVFKSDGGLQVIYDKNNITDNIYITFSDNANYKVNMINFNSDLRYSMKNLNRIDFY